MTLYLYGMHACVAALQNSNRTIEKIFVTDKELLQKSPFVEFFQSSTASYLKQDQKVAKGVNQKSVQYLTKDELSKMLPSGAVHQGIALRVQPLPFYDLSDFLHDNINSQQIIIVLDQVSDPHNVGAILRSAAVFGAKALVLTDRNAPKESGALAKTASGALEVVPMVVVKNLSHSLKALKEAGFWCVAFAEEAQQELKEIDLTGKIALVMGAEGDGLRRLTSQNCDFYAKLQSADVFSTLNVSNAAAIALYETFQQQTGKKTR